MRANSTNTAEKLRIIAEKLRIIVDKLRIIVDKLSIIAEKLRIIAEKMRIFADKLIIFPGTFAWKFRWDILEWFSNTVFLLSESLRWAQKQISSSLQRVAICYSFVLISSLRACQQCKDFFLLLKVRFPTVIFYISWLARWASKVKIKKCNNYAKKMFLSTHSKKKSFVTVKSWLIA